MYRHVPNAITIGRLVLALIFFVLLSWYQYEGRGSPWLLSIAFFVYLVALISDFFDGYLARRWKVVTQFGRIVDPFVDKILVLGGFAFFAGKNFIIPDTEPSAGVGVVKTITGVAPAVVVVLIARELLITTLRSLSEGTGREFGAAWSGKLKMVFQSVTILVILAYVNFRPHLLAHPPAEWYGRVLRDVCIWATLAITVYSGYLYVRRALAPGHQPGPP
jgi:CDP-diacylglycerol---glycerol-3-phosphate 3-phosphatidyltransferase